MATITLRQTKGSPLSFAEMDDNLSNLNNDKLEVIQNLGVVGDVDVNNDYLAIYDSSQNSNRKVLVNTAPFFNRTLVIKALADTLPTYVADGLARIVLPDTFDGLRLSTVGAHVYTVAAGSATKIQIHNETRGVDMLSTLIDIENGENDSATSATPAVIDTNFDDVSKQDVIRIDVDQVGSTTPAKGLELRLEFKG
jgi:hypothetical protein